jgi:nucleotide-binding universal stress UspA family protein
MKTILVLTDYSDVSENSVHYAMKMASAIKAKVILMHDFHLPIPTADMPLVVSYNEMKEMNKKQLSSFYNKIKKEHSEKVMAELVAESGFAVEQILSIIEKGKVDLVIMGVTGAGNSKSILWGSTATSVMKKTKCPVLVIPKQAKFKKPSMIVLAYDFNSVIPDSVSNSMKALINTFQAEVFVFDMLLPAERMYEHALAGVHVDEKFSDSKHSLSFREGEDVIEQINSFVKEKNADWLIMIPHKHNFWESLFQPSNTKKMAFQTNIPLLSVHD